MADAGEENGVPKGTTTEVDTNQSSSKDIEDAVDKQTKAVLEDVMNFAKEEIQKSMSKIMDTGNLSLPKETDTITNGQPQSPNYVEPIPDPYEKSIQYLEKHNIMQLFQVDL